MFMHVFDDDDNVYAGVDYYLLKMMKMMINVKFAYFRLPRDTQ